MATAPGARDASSAQEPFESDSIGAVLKHITSEATRLCEATPEEGHPTRLAAAARDLDSLLQEEPIRELLFELQQSTQSLIGGAVRSPTRVVALAEESATSTLQVFLMAPASIAAFCLLLSLPLLAAEGWTFPVSFDYLVSTACGINPVGEAMDAQPGSLAGGLLLGVAAAWSLGFAGYLMSRIAEVRPFQSYLSFLTRLGEPGDFNIRVMLLQVLVFSPVMVFFVAALLGAVLAVAEGWTLGDGFLYILGDTTGQASPLVGTSPSTRVGMHITSFCGMLGYIVCSTVIGFASNLVPPGMGAALQRLLGQGSRRFGHSKVAPAG